MRSVFINEFADESFCKFFDLHKNKINEYLLSFKKDKNFFSYERPESALACCMDDLIFAECQAVASKFDIDLLRYIVVVGIGGSNLSCKAVYDALGGFYDSVNAHSSLTKIFFVDTLNFRYIEFLKNILLEINDPNELIVITITKSGSTIETIMNTKIIDSIICALPENFSFRHCVITDEGSALYNYAKQKSISCIGIPKSVGGRFSVFSAVGIFPLLCAGIDVAAFRSGAKHAFNDFISNFSEIDKSDIVNSAMRIGYYVDIGYSILDIFIFSVELESLARWYRQLIGESLGKSNDSGVAVGITPTVSVGTVDLHSVGQLYLGGPINRYTQFIRTLSFDKFELPGSNGIFSDFMMEASNFSTSELLDSIYFGVLGAYRKQVRPYMEHILDGVTAYELGYFMEMKMVEVLLVARLMCVNAFDQPHVELYKNGARRFLSDKKS